jgi:hypothetical protein
MCTTDATRAAGAPSVEQTRVRLRRGRTRAVMLVGLLSSVVAAGRAEAGVGVGVAPTYPTLIVVGDTNVPVALSISNTSTPPESGGTLTLSLIRHTPSCGSDTPVPCPAANADPGVFLIKGPAIGLAGTACAGMLFTIGPPDSTGEVVFIPDSPVILAPAGTGPLSTCTINFFVDVLQSPTKDSSAEAGIQTDQLGRVRGVASINMVMGTGTGAGVTTLVQPTPGPTPSITPTSTPTPGPNDCCECPNQPQICAQPDAGHCNLVCPDGTPPAIMPDSVCVQPLPSTPGAGGCATTTPTPTATATSTPYCLDNVPGGIADLIPGFCGPLKPDCLSEICLSAPAPLRPNGLPDNHIVCSNDDPRCDATIGDKACTFIFSICFNLIDRDQRFVCDARGPVTAVHLRLPNEARPKTDMNTENRDAFETALKALGGTISGFRTRSIAFDPPLADTVCTGPIRFKLALRQNPRTLVFSARKFRINYQVFRPAGRFDGDDLFLRCNP